MTQDTDEGATAQPQCTATCGHGGRCSRIGFPARGMTLCGNHHRQHRRRDDAEAAAAIGGPYDAKTFGPSETAKQAREMIAKLVDQHLTLPLRSLPTLSVRDHYVILNSIKRAALEGQGFL